MSMYLVERIRETANIEVLTRHEVVACEGEERLEKLEIRNAATGETFTRHANYLFSFIGAAPRTDWLGDAFARDKRGYLLVGDALVGEHLKAWPLPRRPFPLETNVPGVFAVGDVRADSVKRVASAVGEGSVTVSFVHQHLASL